MSLFFGSFSLVVEGGKCQILASWLHLNKIPPLFNKHFLLIFQIDCTSTQNTALFAAIPFSYGTLGFLTCIDIDIIPYKPYIELTYHNVKTLDEVVDKFTEATNNPEIDSVEGHMYTLNTGVIMSGKFLDKVPSEGKLNTLSR